MSLVLTLASRNLFQDRLRFIATLIGIVFSVVVVSVRMGMFVGVGRSGHAEGRKNARPPARDQWRSPGDSSLDRLCRLAPAKRRQGEAGLRDRIGPRDASVRTVEFGRWQS